MIHQIEFEKCLQFDQNQKRKRMKNNIPHEVRNV